MPTFKVTDQVTNRRTWTVEAENQEQAISKIAAGDWIEPDEIEQIDNAPYEAEQVDSDEPSSDEEEALWFKNHYRCYRFV